MIKNIYLILTLWISTFALPAQTVQPSTIREVYNFEVGDTFIYKRTTTEDNGFPLTCEQTTEIVVSKKLSPDSLVYGFKIIKIEDTIHRAYCSYGAKYNITTTATQIVYINLDSSIFSSLSLWQSFCRNTVNCSFDTIVESSKYDGRKSNILNVYGLSEDYEEFVEGIGLVKVHTWGETLHDGTETNIIYFHKLNELPWSDGTAIINSIPDLPFQKISLYPTLAHEQFTVNLQGELAAKETSLLLYDGLGRKVMDLALTEDKTLLDSGGLGKGFYTWAIVYEGRQVKNGKLIIQ